MCLMPSFVSGLLPHDLRKTPQTSFFFKFPDKRKSCVDPPISPKEYHPTQEKKKKGYKALGFINEKRCGDITF